MRAILTSCNNCNEEYAFKTVSQYIKSDMKVVCIPFASDLNWQLQNDYNEYKERHFRVFKSFGISEDNISIVSINDERDTIINKIVESDIVFFSGGFMENALFLINMLNLNIIMDYIKCTKLIIGESAGTLILQDEYNEVPYIEDAYRYYKRKKGLGFISYYNMMVHYDKNNPKHQENKSYLKNLNKNITVCLSDSSLMIIDGKKIQLIGDYEL